MIAVGARLLVLGGGLSAWACALAVARAGRPVDIVDLPVVTRHETVPMHVPPNMLRDFVVLGVAEACVPAGFPYRQLVHADAKGRLMLVEHTPHLAGPLLPSALGIARSRLTQVLRDAAVQQGATAEPGLRCIGLEVHGDRIDAAFDEGHRRAYALVLATTVEARSLCRIHGAAPEPAFIGQRSWAVQVRRPPELDRPWMAPCISRGRAVALPLSDTHAGVLLSVQGGHEAPAAAHRAPSFRQHMAGLQGLLGAVRERIVDDDAVQVLPIRSGLQPGPWYRGGVLLFGEAAHAVAPHLGQSDAQVIEDAVVLCELLRQSAPPRELAAGFEPRRRARCEAAVALARQAAQWQLSPAADTDIGGLVATQRALVAVPP